MIRNPDFPLVESQWRYKNFSGIVDDNKRKFRTSADFVGEAKLDEDEMMDNMHLVCITTAYLSNIDMTTRAGGCCEWWFGLFCIACVHNLAQGQCTW